MPNRDPVTLSLAILVSVAATAIGIHNLVRVVNAINPPAIERDSSQ